MFQINKIEKIKKESKIYVHLYTYVWLKSLNNKSLTVS